MQRKFSSSKAYTSNWIMLLLVFALISQIAVPVVAAPLANHVPVLKVAKAAIDKDHTDNTGTTESSMLQGNIADDNGDHLASEVTEQDLSNNSGSDNVEGETSSSNNSGSDNVEGVPFCLRVIHSEYTDRKF